MDVSHCTYPFTKVQIIADSWCRQRVTWACRCSGLPAATGEGGGVRARTGRVRTASGRSGREGANERVRSPDGERCEPAYPTLASDFSGMESY